MFIWFHFHMYYDTIFHLEPTYMHTNFSLGTSPTFTVQNKSWSHDQLFHTFHHFSSLFRVRLMPYLQSVIQTVLWRKWTAISWLAFLPNLLGKHPSASQIFMNLSRQLLCEVCRAAGGRAVRPGPGKLEQWERAFARQCGEGGEMRHGLVTVLWTSGSPQIHPILACWQPLPRPGCKCWGQPNKVFSGVGSPESPGFSPGLNVGWI